MGKKVQNKRIILTGGCGFLGAVTAVLLIRNNYEVIIADNFSNSGVENIDAVEKYTGIRPKIYELDITKNLAAVFNLSNVCGVIHLAEKTNLEESVKNPLEFFRVNVAGTVNILNHMQQFNVKNIVFRSRDFVYYDETPYTVSKKQCEEMLKIAHNNLDFNVINLRLFKYVNTDFGINEPENIHTLVKSFAGTNKILNIPNYSHIFDYIHVLDVAESIVSAMNLLVNNDEKGILLNGKSISSKIFHTLDIGLGRGLTIPDFIDNFCEKYHTSVRYSTNNENPDYVKFVADISKSQAVLNWKPNLPIF